MSSPVVAHVFYQTRKQKSAMEERLLWGTGSSAGGDLGAEPPALKNFYFFAKVTYFRLILIKISAFKTWHQGELWGHRNEQTLNYTLALSQKSAMVGLF